MNDYRDFDLAMSKICDCSHLRGEHDWSSDKFNQKCLDNNCDCQTYHETNDQKVIEKHYARTAEQFEQDERSRN